MDKLGKTKVSASLHAGPGSKRVIDKLEPNYPLIVHDEKKNGWLKVTARPQGARDEAQTGWMDFRLVEVFQVESPHLLRSSEWRVLAVALSAPVLLALLWWFLS